MKVLVTGGSGFIGTNMVSLLIDKGFDVVNYDIKKPKIESHLKFWTEVDICNKTQIEMLFKNDNPDYVIHLAARTDLNEKSDLEGYKANIEGVRNVINASATLTNLKRIIVASSMLVCKLGYLPSGFHDYAPNSLYGESKVFTEKIVKESNLDWVIVRPTSIWGPWFGEPYRNFFNLVISGLYFNVPKLVSSTKTYGYVGNTCLQIYNLLLSEDLSVTKNYFYLGDDPPINVTDWATRIRKLNNQSRPIIMPVNVLRFAALIGDVIQKYSGFSHFPMNSFRYRNMTNNNIIADLHRTIDLTKCGRDSNFDVQITETLDWLKNINKIK